MHQFMHRVLAVLCCLQLLQYSYAQPSTTGPVNTSNNTLASTTAPTIQGQVSTINSTLNTNGSIVDLGFTTLRPTNNTQSYYVNNFYSGVVVPPLSGVAQYNYSVTTGNTTITLLLTNIPNGKYSLQVREYGNLVNRTYGPIYNSATSNPTSCSYYLGEFTINQEYMNQSSVYTFESSSIGLNGTNSIIGRSILIINDTAVSVLSGQAPSCGVINIEYDLQTVVADGIVGISNPNTVNDTNVAIQPNVNSNTSTIADLIPASLYYFAGYDSNECLTYNTTTQETGQLLCNTSYPQQYFTLQPTTQNSSTFQLINFVSGECWAVNASAAPVNESSVAPSNANLLAQSLIFNPYATNSIVSVACNTTDSTQYWTIDLTRPYTAIGNPASNLCIYSFSSEAGGLTPCNIYDASQAWGTHLLPQVENFSGSVQYYTANDSIYQTVNITGLIPYSQVGLFLTTYGVDPDASNAITALLSQQSTATNNTTTITNLPTTTVPTTSVVSVNSTSAPLNTTSTSTTQQSSVTVSQRRLQQLQQTLSSNSPGLAETSVPTTSAQSSTATATTNDNTTQSTTVATPAAQLSNTSQIVGASQALTSNSTIIFTADSTGTIHNTAVVGNVIINNSTYNVIGRGLLIQYITVPTVPSDNSSLLYSAANSYLAFGAVGLNNGIS